MARLLATLLAVAALLAAGRLSHAAPSTTEVFLRNVLKSAVVPDAVLRRLRTGTSSVSEGMAVTAKKAGRSPSGLDYDDYARALPTAGKAAPYNYAYQTPSESSEANDDDVPFNYSYKRTSDGGEVRDDDVPFNYSYKDKESGEAGAGGGATASEARGGGDATSPSKDGEENVSAPYNYSYKEPGGATTSAARGGGGDKATTTTTTVFFHEESVRVGERLRFRFPAASPAPLGLLPRHVADSIPFSTPALPHILALFNVAPGSSQAAAMAETLRTCEWPPLAGEAKFCASSLETLAERAMATLGTRDVRPVTSALPRAGAPLQAYAVRAVWRVEGGEGGASASFLACHDEAYPYTVYRCHTTGPARAYLMEMEGADDGAAITVATVCHTDTSRWNPEHLSFKLLGTKPGGAPICHLMPYGHIIWAKNVKRSPA
ncbi:hypothetical protein EJB05_48516 [Eragrostis curvula]|uniref:BURP domain-containing protein n=1 Tax=Eragrostis curvula TaxID=38414 RepID=A0A5J9T2E3_9POAL|nr:hypothetical protein EJB05_48516 [Eragrostis curvula]